MPANEAVIQQSKQAHRREDGDVQLVTPEERSEARVLVVDDERSSLDSCSSLLESEGYRVDTYRKGREAIEQLKRRSYQVALIDQSMPDVDGFQVLQALQEHSPSTFAVVMTGYASAEDSVRAIQGGAWDYLPKPFTATQLLVLVDRACDTWLRMRTLAPGDGPESREEGVLVDNGVRILGVSDAMKEVVKRALKVAPTDASVFVTGESGTGKELIARCIHLESRRSNQSFVPVNCSAIPEELLESEMFGHRKGAFTGAVRDKAGLLETADGGTCFLDELAEMPSQLQPKLLRVLQDGILRRVGSEKNDTVVDVRFISATNRPAEEALEQGSLRYDLYYRLRVIPIHIPPLRERREDIPVIASHVMRHFWERHRTTQGPAPRLSSDAVNVLMNHSWPGNVRELKNVLEQVVVLSDAEEEIGPADLPPLEGAALPHGNGSGGITQMLSGLDGVGSYHDLKDDLVGRFERQYLSLVITRAGGNMSEAARRADIDRTSLYRLLEKHDLSKEQVMEQAMED